MLSNGSLIDEDVVDLFRRRPPGYLRFTLYGASNETYEKLCGVKDGFDRVMWGLRFDGEWRAYGSPWAGSSPYIKNVKAPLAGIVVLKQAPENRIRRLNAAEVMAYLYNNVRYPFWDEEATAASLETLDALIGEIPIFLLECRPDEEAVRITRDAIFGAEA